MPVSPRSREKVSPWCTQRACCCVGCRQRGALWSRVVQRIKDAELGSSGVVVVPRSRQGRTNRPQRLLSPFLS